MSKSHDDSKELMIFANREGRVAELRKWVGSVFIGKETYCLVSVSNNADTKNDAFAELPGHVTRALIVFEDLPVNMGLVDIWRNWATDRGAWEVHVAFLGFFKGSNAQRFKEIMGLCKGWSDPVPNPEPPAVEKKQFVRMSSDSKERNLATLLTMTLGGMGDLLTQVELLARRFRESIPTLYGKPDETVIKEYLDGIDVLLRGNRRSSEEQPRLKTGESSDGLPKLLLSGDSGVGKSLIAAYLHSKTGWAGRPLRIPIPEYLRKEDMFEYDLFGYCKGAYTGGKDEGSRGLLLGNTGRVVFLDEIGEANEYLQAKLLAFLDDYKVRPRGWEGEPFFCPVLIVAATNKDLDHMVKTKRFRGDLLARFSDRHKIPSLQERIDDLPFILDCLLQRSSMNPGLRIQQIGQQAFEFLKSRGFGEGNFRELENLFRAACERAIRDNGRTHLVKADFEQS